MEDRIETILGAGVRSTTELDGGKVGTVHRVDLADGRTVVAKTGETPLSVEARMLRYLDRHGLAVPYVLSADDDLLVLSYVEGDAAITEAVERDLADRLATLHGTTADGVGFPFDTLCGPLPQPNPWTDRWIPFYREHRLAPVRERCLEAGALVPSTDDRLTAALERLEELLVEPEEPGLVHGDVWEGNLLTDGRRVRAFLDPACYYGHPEVELAYVDWAGVGTAPFFERYRRRRGIAPGFFETRRFVYRLYPLLVHCLLFGSPYDDEIAATLDRLDP